MMVTEPLPACTPFGVVPYQPGRHSPAYQPSLREI